MTKVLVFRKKNATSADALAECKGVVKAWFPSDKQPLVLESVQTQLSVLESSADRLPELFKYREVHWQSSHASGLSSEDQALSASKAFHLCNLASATFFYLLARQPPPQAQPQPSPPPPPGCEPSRKVSLVWRHCCRIHALVVALFVASQTVVVVVWRMEKPQVQRRTTPWVKWSKDQASVVTLYSKILNFYCKTIMDV